MPTSTAKDVVLKNRAQRLRTVLGADKTFLVRAEIKEGLSTLSDIDVQFLANDINLDIGKIVGQQVTIEMDYATNEAKDTVKTRYFHGWCIECAYEDTMGGLALFRAELRPWFWFLTRTRNCRIFQNKSVVDILKQVLGDHGFSSSIKTKLNASYKQREYTVQYRESDFDFLSRLMEEAGIYWYTEHDKTKETLVFADGPQAHQALTDAASVDFIEPEEGFSSYRRSKNHLYEFSIGETVQPGKVSLRDYDFLNPRSDLTAFINNPLGSHPRNKFEQYDYPGSYTAVADGRQLAQVRHEVMEAEHIRARAVGNVPTMAAGGKFALKGHDRRDVLGEHVVITCRHFLQVEVADDKKGKATSALDALLNFEDIAETYRHEIVVQKASTQYRAPQVTPWPQIPGIQTATVTGKKGEEIHTNQWGCVLVQFHWDRLGKNDENTTCFIRCAVPWSGEDWGWQSVPRIGQEVVVQFEDGDPDKPLITGMLYNGNKKPAEAWPDSMTMTGLRTRSTKKGGDGYHELMFEDLKGSEFVRFQCQKDYFGLIKNRSVEVVGFEKMADGDKQKAVDGGLYEKIKSDFVTEITEGDHTEKVMQGNQLLEVKRDRTVTVDANEAVTVAKKKDDAIGQDYSVDVGKTMTIKANTKIVLQCGQSKIEMTPSAIKISSTNIEEKASMNHKIQAGMNLQAKGGMKFQAEGGMQMQLKGGMQFKAEGGMMGEVKGGMMFNVKSGLMTSVKSSLMTQLGGSIVMVK
ncbi:MAG: type VI secretion system tip protein TssI/VgrG [Pseudomonadota bacterium]